MLNAMLAARELREEKLLPVNAVGRWSSFLVQLCTRPFHLVSKLENIYKFQLIPPTFICFSFLFHSFRRSMCGKFYIYFISTNRLHIKSHFSYLNLEYILSSKAHSSTCVATVKVYKIFNRSFTLPSRTLIWFCFWGEEDDFPFFIYFKSEKFR